MKPAIKLVLEECNETTDTVETLDTSLQAYGFDKLKKVATLTDLINRKGRGGYSRV